MAALPGQEMSVSEVISSLRSMWQSTGDPSDAGAPSEFHASQLNLVVHFGVKTPVAEAKAIFDSAIEFAKRYPCRIVVLCPSDGGELNNTFQGKLFTQCYIGESHRRMCCCEALLLAYSPKESEYLADQVSLWLESDLPVYYWVHRVPAHRLETHYGDFLKSFRRLVYDSSVGGNLPDQLNNPDGLSAGDLAIARNLPLRQSIGQFLSTFDPEILVKGLNRVTVSYNEGKSAEAENLLAWNRQCIAKALELAGINTKIAYEVQPVETGDRETLAIEWSYKGSSYFNWRYYERSQLGEISSNFGNGRISQPMQLKPLAPAQALSEALFFPR